MFTNYGNVIDKFDFSILAGNFLYGVNFGAKNCDFSSHQENVTSSEGAISFYHQKLPPNWTIYLTFLVEKWPNILRCITKIGVGPIYEMTKIRNETK